LRIPFLTSFAEKRKQSKIEAQRSLEIENQLHNARQDLIKSVMASALPQRSLSDELYNTSPGSPYKLGLWRLPITTLRNMSRIAYWDSSTARAIINRYVQMVVGPGLTLHSEPAWGM